MNAINVKLEQIQKVKGEAVIVSIRSKAIDCDKVNTIEGQINAVTRIMEGFKFTLDLAAQSGAKVVNFGGVKFRLSSKFTLYISVDGKDYSFDEIDQFFEGSASKVNTFKKSGELATDLFAILRNAVGQSPILPARIVNTLNSVKEIEGWN